MGRGGWVRATVTRTRKAVGSREPLTSARPTCVGHRAHKLMAPPKQRTTTVRGVSGKLFDSPPTASSDGLVCILRASPSPPTSTSAFTVTAFSSTGDELAALDEKGRLTVFYLASNRYAVLKRGRARRPDRLLAVEPGGRRSARAAVGALRRARRRVDRVLRHGVEAAARRDAAPRPQPHDPQARAPPDARPPTLVLGRGGHALVDDHLRPAARAQRREDAAAARRRLRDADRRPPHVLRERGRPVDPRPHLCRHRHLPRQSRRRPPQDHHRLLRRSAARRRRRGRLARRLVARQAGDPAHRAAAARRRRRLVAHLPPRRRRRRRARRRRREVGRAAPDARARLRRRCAADRRADRGAAAAHAQAFVRRRARRACRRHRRQRRPPPGVDARRRLNRRAPPRHSVRRRARRRVWRVAPNRRQARRVETPQRGARVRRRRRAAAAAADRAALRRRRERRLGAQQQRPGRLVFARRAAACGRCCGAAASCRPSTAL